MATKIVITNRFSGAVMYDGESESLKQYVEYLVKEKRNLSGADLSDADLSDADLSDAILRGANLRGADLSDANLSGADLSDTYLSCANLSDAYLSGADLSGANLRGADLSGAKGYSCNHYFFQEVIRRQKVSHFTESEWALVGKLMTHLWCWGTLTKPEYIDALTSILTKLSALGFGEFLDELIKRTEPAKSQEEK